MKGLLKSDINQNKRLYMKKFYKTRIYLKINWARYTMYLLFWYLCMYRNTLRMCWSNGSCWERVRDFVWFPLDFRCLPTMETIWIHLSDLGSRPGTYPFYPMMRFSRKLRTGTQIFLQKSESMRIRNQCNVMCWFCALYIGASMLCRDFTHTYTKICENV